MSCQLEFTDMKYQLSALWTVSPCYT